MSSASIYKELRDRYKGGTSVSTEYPNEEFTKPVPATIWARFTVLQGESFQLDIGSPVKTFRTIGVLVVQLFAPLDAGVIGVLDEADIIASLFRNWCGQTITCRTPSIEKIGNDTYGWYQVNVAVPFHTDELY